VVAARLEEAADVLARLPEAKVCRMYDLWPRLMGASCASVSPAAPAPEAIDRMDEALGWLAWLEPPERGLVWMRAEGLPWKRITHRLALGRTTAWQRWTVALHKIVSRLNAAAEHERTNIELLNKRAHPVLQRR
jgi:hypothetical protein